MAGPRAVAALDPESAPRVTIDPGNQAALLRSPVTHEALRWSVTHEALQLW